ADLAPLQDRPPVGDQHGMGPPAPLLRRAQAQVLDPGLVGLEPQAGRALDDDLLPRPVADQFQGLVDGEALLVDPRAHEAAGARTAPPRRRPRHDRTPGSGVSTPPRTGSGSR